MHTAKWLLTFSLVAAAIPLRAAPGDGLKAPDDLNWSRWQGRLSIGAATPPRVTNDPAAAVSPGLRPPGFSLMGDYLFGRNIGDGGRASAFRATGGVVFGQRSALWIGAPRAAAGPFSVDRRPVGDATYGNGVDGGDPAAAPYVGVGYVGGSVRGGWGYSADFGLVGTGGAVKLGRMISAGQGLEDTLRELRLSPVLQLGVSYSF